MIYFDHQATTKMNKDVLDAMMDSYKYYGNPSSIYSLGQKSKGIIEEKRLSIANMLNVNPKEIFFTSGGTESDNWALIGTLKKGDHLITSMIEHHAILHTANYLEGIGVEVTYLKPERDGSIKLDSIKSAIKENTKLISLMTANNEIGIINDIKSIGKLARDNGILFHTDAVAAMFKTPIDFKDCDLASITAHKFNGPKGIGILYVKEGTKINNILFGGAQERGKRPGTESVALIVGLEKAMKIHYNREHNNYVKELRDYLIKNLNEMGIKINGSLKNRLDCNVNFISKNSSEITLLRLDMEGIMASAGSACTAGAMSPSHVLTAIGLSEEEANSSIRISLDIENTKEEIDTLIRALR
ncbi:cysteine desulfurase family protein [Peptoniphilus sp. BV3AC2]|uniref:cysteine desulfurase family protein n=1 Tax=Peptoniphilus sp. BV3AC2 TaxID=1111133 RepID=UPI0003B7F273|nr:cysteine desulfurase family protein [Peptoniphilus sp. BV3AC2]ERT63431.1 aminotransferase, class V [Peptoniphilus sp. BV3AC2]